MVDIEPAPSETRDAILAIESEIDRARVSKDTDVFERVIADDFTTTSPVGGTAGKAGLIEDVRSGTFDVRSSRSGDLTVIDLGETAVVLGTAVLRARHAGHDISGAYAYTHVYARRAEGWQVVAAQSARTMPDWLFIVMTRITNLLRIKRK